MNTTTKLKLFLLFLLINITVYTITNINKKDKIDLILGYKLSILNTHYEVLLETQHRTAIALYKSTLMNDRIIEIMKEANTASKEKKAELRDELHNLLKVLYDIAQEKYVLQYQFVLPNNKSFYRAHKPDKFGDDLTNVRADFKYTNETKKPIRGFMQGKTTHALRNIFPLFDKNNTYVGAVEISFSSESFEWYLNTISHIHAHFIVSKKIFVSKAWKRDDLIFTYIQSAESKDYMLALGDIHTKEICVIENKIKLEPIREEIDSKMLLGKKFSSYVDHKGHVDVMSFLPIRNIHNKVVAWIVSYQESSIIYSVIKVTLIMRIISFLISILIIYFLLNQIKSKEELEKQHKFLNDILNETDDIMFITNFKDIRYSNDKFKSFISEQNYNILNIFVRKDGYLHCGLLEEGEDFISLVTRTAPKDRIVSILDKNLKETIFKISISQSENEGYYLVTLSDVTRMKEYQIKTEKKVYIDGLTNVYNRNKFDEVLEDEIKNIKRYNNSLSIAILDIDKFKDFNDNYGHLVGDAVLITLAQTVNASVRETDVFARWGGEEFVILFKNTPVDIAKQVSEKLKDKIEANSHPTAGRITASFGVTEYKDGDTLESIFKRCDDALYLAKENGRNRVEVL